MFFELVNCFKSSEFEGTLPAEVHGGILAVDLWYEVADESLLVKSSVVSAEEVVARTEQAVVVYLEKINHFYNTLC